MGQNGRIYVAQGEGTDRGPVTQLYEGTIFSRRADGSDIRVYATGFRNPFDIDFNSRGDMFTADNGANVKIGERSTRITRCSLLSIRRRRLAATRPPMPAPRMRTVLPGIGSLVGPLGVEAEQPLEADDERLQVHHFAYRK